MQERLSYGKFRYLVHESSFPCEKKIPCKFLKGFSDILELNDMLPTFCKLKKETF